MTPQQAAAELEDLRTWLRDSSDYLGDHVSKRHMFGVQLTDDEWARHQWVADKLTAITAALDSLSHEQAPYLKPEPPRVWAGTGSYWVGWRDPARNLGVFGTIGEAEQALRDLQQHTGVMR